MTEQTSRREQLAQAATDYVLEHGLVGLSLRPLAAAIGTSDRMLLYHFGTKHDLVSAVLRVANDRSVALLNAIPPAPDVRSAVPALWRAVTSPEQDRCQRMYVEAAALGLLGTEPYVSVVQEANEIWLRAMAHQLVAAGLSPERAQRAAVLVDAAFMGFQLDLPVGADTAVVERAVADLAEAVVGIAAQGSE